MSTEENEKAPAEQAQEVLVPEMPMYNAALKQAEAGIPMDISAIARRPTVSEMLQHKKLHLEYQLQCVNEAIAQAKQQEGAMGLLDALAKAQVKDY